MYKFGKAVVKGRFVILILSLGLLVPSLLGMLGTRINYDILSYLPSDLDTMKGQDFMMEDFGKGGFAFVMIDGMKDFLPPGLTAFTMNSVESGKLTSFSSKKPDESN